MRNPEKVETTALPNATAMMACCGGAIAALVPVALYQTGVLRRLPDPPMEVFASERITSSKVAHPMGVPDALLGLGSFGATLGLVLAARRSAAVRPVLGAKLAIDAGTAMFNLGRQVVVFRKLCSWCTGTAMGAIAMAVAGRRLIAATGRLAVAQAAREPK